MLCGGEAGENTYLRPGLERLAEDPDEILCRCPPEWEFAKIRTGRRVKRNKLMELR